MSSQDETIKQGRPDPEAERRSAQRDLPELLRRRLRDRLEEEDEELHHSALLQRAELRTPVLLCEDALRQTARTLGELERFVLSVHRTLGKLDLSGRDLKALLAEDVVDKADVLGDALAELRRSLRQIADQIAP